MTEALSSQPHFGFCSLKKELECKNIMIQGSDPGETKGLISYFLKIGKENLQLFSDSGIKAFKEAGSEVTI